MEGRQAPPRWKVTAHRLIVRSCAERDSAIAIGVCATIPAGLGRLFLARADAAMARFRAIYQEACVRHTVPLRGAHDCLAHAHARGLGIAIVTNKPLAPTQRIIDALGWRSIRIRKNGVVVAT